MSPAETLQDPSLYTIGHSDRSLRELVEILREVEIEILVDVRAYPESRRNPQFCEDSLREASEEAGIQYHCAGRQLGGRRKPAPNSLHSALSEDGLRAFADYMDTDSFKIAAMQLLRLSQRGPLCMLCAERLPRHCHRALIADYLTLRGERIIHLLAPGEPQEHQLREELRRESLRVVYDRLPQTFSDLN